MRVTDSSSPSHWPPTPCGACVEAQGLLRAETWPDDGVVRVRMGVHAGLAAPRGADYISYAIHQAARVVGAAHGGQVVVSADAVAEIAGSVPFEIQLLGRYRLRDFDEPVELFQAADDPQEDFGALRAIPAEGHNLIRPLTSYLGREADHAGVRSLLGPGRLVSVVGPGGVGKTRLAVETGLELASQWRDGVWLIELAPVVSGEFVASVVAAALGLATTDQAPLAVLVSQLRSSHTLIILDNCEHVRDAVSALVDLVLRECPEVAMLATSREPLGLGREVVWRLDPLGAEGVALFVERARTANANFAPNAESLAIVERICRRLDGLPLAIELAAAHVGHRNQVEILSGLDKRIGLLRSRRTDLDDRHCSLNALLDWSHELLNEQEGARYFADSPSSQPGSASRVRRPLLVGALSMPTMSSKRCGLSSTSPCSSLTSPRIRLAIECSPPCSPTPGRNSSSPASWPPRP